MKFVIIGCGRVGAGLAQSLAGHGHTVAVIDKDPAAFARLGERFHGQTIAGMGFDRDVLLQAGIQRADGVAALTSSDEANIVIARIARDVFHVPRVVARLSEISRADVYQRLGIQTIVPTTWGIQRIAELLLYSPLETVYSLGSGDVELIEIDVTPILAGKTVRDLTVSGEIHLVAITRNNKTFLPTQGTIFQPHDRLHLAVLTASANRLRTLLGF